MIYLFLSPFKREETKTKKRVLIHVPNNSLIEDALLPCFLSLAMLCSTFFFLLLLRAVTRV